MSLRSFLVGLFRGYSADGELEDVEEAGRQDARTFTGAYLRGFVSETDRLFQAGTQRLLGEEVEHDDVLDGEFRVVKTRKKPGPKPGSKRKVKAKVKRR